MSGGERPAGPPESARSVSTLVAEAVRLLAGAGADAPRASAELLAARAFGLSRLELLTYRDHTPAPAERKIFLTLAARRAKGEPLAYILGEKEFYGLPFAVTPDVLIPRPETELLVEEALRLFPAEAPLRFADFGCGSGCLAVALAHVFPQSRGLAVDLSGAALEIARQNARANAVAERIEFLCADFTALELAPGSLDLVVANPPYVSEDEYAALDHGVRGFEPASALLSPERGLRHIRGLLPVAARALKPGGILLCEHGAGQGRAAVELAQAAQAFEPAETLADLAGLDRALKAVRSAG